MKNAGISILILSFIFLAGPTRAETSGYRGAEEKAEELRPGMEIKKIGNVRAVVPEGSQVYEKNGLFLLEAPEEYAARRFKGMTERLESMDNHLEKLEETVKTLESELDKLKNPPEAEPEPKAEAKTETEEQKE